MDQRNIDIIGRQSGRQKKKAKGTVKIESDKGWLRLRVRIQVLKREIRLHSLRKLGNVTVR